MNRAACGCSESMLVTFEPGSPIVEKYVRPSTRATYLVRSNGVMLPNPSCPLPLIRFAADRCGIEIVTEIRRSVQHVPCEEIHVAVLGCEGHAHLVEQIVLRDGHRRAGAVLHR